MSTTDGRADIVATVRYDYKVYALLSIYTHQPLPLLHLYAHRYLEFQIHIFNALTLIGTIRAIIYGKVNAELSMRMAN
ncbi:MAG: TLC domain-containing protein [Candidatus Midichloria mitochondrii]|uniref:Uncharacterized protein n=1 Tax=Midichloria mitochondrii (strain IricVA) TaxID=696127 RepID=F7XU76_MIDMI|nr:hypothetical protein [Candidatus Midichloria mitochondrii]AEI89435.1 hypothetical protein midi_01159 [Candidatus Midichloria mitochondrii IricVA]MDJ1256892.1 hypothetical protein [Candidatus Midichloria mitochondrii]MDJ1288620.1 hypothetical protein [Candidatus Midichloria mitochondrii]MDJ1299443.1 hypothetical protein [Candidatus Midichloria mitochondrii]MDJ1313551.1 hypothetical protein [Candidatus Midichloria mitochondrii]